ncbi:hypothetical protein [Rhizomonospora bruguierae]|uniref:hypothetical protein n=1 Tax=Rhizomonospora bruguierae TaxID=1581705 RepID=UPI001BCFA052|nr:hypothetical protein [Micromonospora sp. NBRC 107566]
MRIPTFTRRADATRDESAIEPAADRRDQVDDRTVYRSRAAVAADATATGRTARTADTAADRTTHTADTEPVKAERAGPVRRPRTSLMANLGLALGVVAALGVLSGRLAAYGLAVGVVALLLSLAGMSATRRRHVAGKADALLGLLLSLAAIVVGILALAGALPWLGTGADTVTRVRDWLDAHWNAWF